LFYSTFLRQIGEEWRGVKVIKKMRAVSINTVPVVIKRNGSGHSISSWAAMEEPTRPKYAMVFAMVDVEVFPFKEIVQVTRIIAG
jgi:hypothetical protein